MNVVVLVNKDARKKCSNFPSPFDTGERKQLSDKGKQCKDMAIANDLLYRSYEMQFCHI